MQEIIEEREPALPGELQRLRTALLADQQGILTATRSRLARIARARGIDSTVIDDVVQETLLEAWSHLGRLTAPAGFHAWIDGICRNVCRRYTRRYQLDQRRQVSFAGSHEQHESISDEDRLSPFTNLLDPDTLDPLELLSRQELALLVDRALGLLPEEARQIVELCHLLDMPHSEVAERLGISVGALDTRLHRARRQLLQLLQGPLQQEAASFGLISEQGDDEGWFDTRLWCLCCGRYRLQGAFVKNEAEGSMNLHVRCPGCAEEYGLDTAHSMGLVGLGKLKSFRPAWKRTVQGLTDLALQALQRNNPPCPWCGNVTSIRVADAEEEGAPPLGPYRFWIRWHCTYCGGPVCSPGDLPMVDQVVYWSHPRARQFMTEHPRCLSTFGTELEYAGQPALCFQLSDATSAASLTVLAHRYTLRMLAGA